MDTSTTSLIVGAAVIALVAGLGLTLAKRPGAVAEARLDGLSGQRPAKSDPNAGILLRPRALDLSNAQGLAGWLPDLDGLGKLYEQADVGLAFRTFLAIAAGLALAGTAVGLVMRLPLAVAAAGGAAMGVLPFFWLVLRKRKRVKAFTAQMPDALELVARALRAGHGLASGLSVVADEMPPPIAIEFGRVFEEQNLGIALEDSLRGLAERVPTMDVRFFVTAVVIQRATGGDLAEILDKIGRIVRERFQILGQVQALTAEGRLSGIVLLALPPSLLAFIYMTNPDYCGVLFATTEGVQMLAAAAVLQVLGAIAIKKIITIKV